MKPSACVSLPEAMLVAVERHLFPPGRRTEQGGFLYCTCSPHEQGLEFAATGWEALRPPDYVAQESDYLELTDAARARIIKLAHDRAAALVEFHCHPFPLPACLSYADMAGLAEFVPHVRWRLKSRPYGALVFGPSSVDGLVWAGAFESPVPISHVKTETRHVLATGLTLGLTGQVPHG